jgi:hypothetical protein
MWRQYAPVLLAGFSCGMGLTGMFRHGFCPDSEIPGAPGLLIQEPALRKTVRPWKPPADLFSALAPFSSEGFSWEKKGRMGRGFSLHCPTCDTAILLQFHFDVEQEPETAGAILSSLRDHTQDGRSHWHLYDINAVIPPGYRLTSYRLEAGMFHLAFRGGRTALDLFRWGPARTLLADGDLERFAASRAELPILRNCRWNSIHLAEGVGIEWQRPDKRRFPWQKQTRSRGRIWYLTAANRILGVLLQGENDSNPTLFEAICHGFSTL